MQNPSKFRQLGVSEASRGGGLRVERVRTLGEVTRWKKPSSDKQELGSRNPTW